MAVNICSKCVVWSKAPTIGGVTKYGKLPSGIDIYEYGTGRKQASERATAYNPYTHVFRHCSDTSVNRGTVIEELSGFNSAGNTDSGGGAVRRGRGTGCNIRKKYRSECMTCKCIIRRIRLLLTELSQINVGKLYAICEHCENLAEGIKCQRCLYIINKFKCSNIQILEHQRRLRSWISKMKELQDLLDCKCVPGLVKNAHDLLELRRILNEMYPPIAPRCTPKLCDWASSLDKLYKNKEVFQRILDQMGDEDLAMPSGVGMLGDANLGDGKSGASSQLLRVPEYIPAQTIKTPTAPGSDVTKISKKATTSKVPSQGRKNTRGRSEGTARSPGTLKSKGVVAGKEQQKSIVDGETEITLPKGLKSAFTYRLSDKRFIDNGWTKLPKLKTERVYHIYEMTPILSDNDWMALNKCKGVIYYDTGEILAIFKESGAVTGYYKNGMVALVYNGPKRPEGDDDGNQFMYVLYSSEFDMRKKQTILAKFDYCGGGVVYDHQGNERLKYNQNTGELFDKNGPTTTWLWHNLNEPPIYRKRFVDTYVQNPDPILTKIIEENEQLTEKHDNIDKTSKTDKKIMKIDMEKHAKKNEKTFEMYTIRIKRIMINEFFSLKIICQTQIYLMFCDRCTRFRLDLGLEIKHKVSRREYVVVADENYNICDHLSQPGLILKQVPQFEQDRISK